MDFQATSKRPIELDKQQNLDGLCLQGTHDWDHHDDYNADSDDTEQNLSSVAVYNTSWFHTWPLTWYLKLFNIKTHLCLIPIESKM